MSLSECGAKDLRFRKEEMGGAGAILVWEYGCTGKEAGAERHWTQLLPETFLSSQKRGLSSVLVGGKTVLFS